MIIRAPATYAATANKLRAKLSDHAEGASLYWGQTVPAWRPPNTLGIHHILDKPAQLTAFINAGLDTPDFTTSYDEARSLLRRGFQVLGRTRFGTQGQGIRSPGREWRRWWTGARTSMPPLVTRAWRNSEWWSVLVTGAFDEYRFHIVGTKSIQRSLKVHTSPHLQGILPIRNRRNGWTLIRDCALPSTTLRDVAKAAVAAVNYPWGAVDLIYRPTTSECIVLEVNTAPGMDDCTATKWANAIRSEFPSGVLRTPD